MTDIASTIILAWPFLSEAFMHVILLPDFAFVAAAASSSVGSLVFFFFFYSRVYTQTSKNARTPRVSAMMPETIKVEFQRGWISDFFSGGRMPQHWFGLRINTLNSWRSPSSASQSWHRQMKFSDEIFYEKKKKHWPGFSENNIELLLRFYQSR